MPRYQPYKPAALRRLEAGMTKLAEKVHNVEAPEPKARAASDWTWLEDKMAMGVANYKIPCACAGLFEACGQTPTKPRLLPTAMSLDLIPLEDRADPRLFVNLCDRCFLLKLAAVDGLKSKTRWVTDTAAAIRMAPAGVRNHYSLWSARLMVTITYPLQLAELLVDEYRAKTEEYTINRYQSMPEIPAGRRVLYINTRRAREGVIVVIVESQ